MNSRRGVGDNTLVCGGTDGSVLPASLGDCWEFAEETWDKWIFANLRSIIVCDGLMV